MRKTLGKTAEQLSNSLPPLTTLSHPTQKKKGWGYKIATVLNNKKIYGILPEKHKSAQHKVYTLENLTRIF